MKKVILLSALALLSLFTSKTLNSVSRPRPVIGAGSTAPSSITVTYPNGGEVFSVGQSLAIRWTSTNVDRVTVAYRTSANAYGLIANYIPNNNYLPWIVNVNVGYSIPAFAKIWIVGYSSIGTSVVDSSNQYFAITPLPTPTLFPTCPPCPPKQFCPTSCVPLY